MGRGQDQGPPDLEHAPNLGHGRDVGPGVLDDLEHHDGVERTVREGEALDIAANGLEMGVPASCRCQGRLNTRMPRADHDHIVRLWVNEHAGFSIRAELRSQVSSRRTRKNPIRLLQKMHPHKLPPKSQKPLRRSWNRSSKLR